MERTELASPDIERIDEDEKVLKELSSNSTQLTDRESDADKSKDPYMEMPESSLEDEQTITTFSADSSYIVTCRVSIALAILKGMAVVLFQCTVFHIYICNLMLYFKYFFLDTCIRNKLTLFCLNYRIHFLKHYSLYSLIKQSMRGTSPIQRKEKRRQRKTHRVR